MKETCEKMLTTMSLICQQLESIPWTDDFEYICWAYLVEDLTITEQKNTTHPNKELLEYFDFLKTSAENINGWVNDITYFEMNRWLVLYDNWRVRNLTDK